MAKKQNKIVVIAAGGTGGHIFPAQSLCGELLERGFDPFFICDSRTKQFLQEPLLSVKRHQIISMKPSGSFFRKVIGLICLVVSSLIICSKFIVRRPAYVVGFGGYPSFPTMLAALLLRIPFFIHEQNSILGRVNRLFAKYATKVFVTFPKTKHAPKHNTVFTGNFVRKEVLAFVGKKGKKAKDKFSILVIGGSQGAQVFSNFIPEVVNSFPKNMQKNLRVTQQARSNLVEKTQRKYEKTSAKVLISDFFTNIGELMQDADLIICRAGASTISELLALGKASILIPYKHAMDNHQFYNAKFLSDCGAGVLIEEDDFDSKKIAETILSMMKDDKKIKNIQKHVKELNKANPQKIIFNYIK